MFRAVCTILEGFIYFQQAQVFASALLRIRNGLSVNSLLLLLPLLFTYPVNASDPWEKEEKHAPSGQFDFNVYAFTWQPGYCLKYGKDHCPNRFYVHGVWPYFNLPEDEPHNTHRHNVLNYHPSYCYNSPGCISSKDCEINDLQVHEIMNDPSIKDLYPQSTSLFKHEWHKHGTCSGMKPKDYFLQADTYRKMIFSGLAPLNRLISQHKTPFTISVSDIKPLLPENTGLRCTRVNGQTMLFEIFYFIDRDGNPHTTQTQIGMDCSGQIVIPVSH